MISYSNDGAKGTPKPKSIWQQTLDGYNKTVYYNENPQEVNKVVDLANKVNNSITPKQAFQMNKTSNVGLVVGLIAGVLLLILIKR